MKNLIFLFLILTMLILMQSGLSDDTSSKDSIRAITKIDAAIKTVPITPTPTPIPTQTYVWSQTKGSSSMGIISVYYMDQPKGRFSTDDFRVTDPVHIDTIKVEGFYSSQATEPILYYFWYIYPNQNGQPAGAPISRSGREVWSYCCKPDAPEVTEGTSFVTLDLNAGGVPPLNLEGGRYWLCFFAGSPYGTFNNWYITTSDTENLDPAHFLEVIVAKEKETIPWQSWPEKFGSIYYDAAFRIDGGVIIPESYKKWSQPPIRKPDLPHPECYYGWNEYSFYSPGPIVADDFLCSDIRPITDIHWWGSYSGWLSDAKPPQDFVPDSFHLGIWTDVPKEQNGLYSHPGQMIWESVVSMGDLKEKSVGCDYYPEYTSETCFLYNYHIPEANWFYQDDGSTSVLWLSIAAMYSEGVPPSLAWGWKTRDLFYNDEAILITDPTSPEVSDIYTAGIPASQVYQRGPWDMAFKLTTNVPPPTPTPDIQNIIEYLLGKNPTPTPSDVNSDGYVDIADLITLMLE